LTRDWDAATYDRVSAPQVEWALRVLERLPLRGDETVLDAGCGSGRVTRLLLERLPHGHVVAVDSSTRTPSTSRTGAAVALRGRS
jgi:trans-aconitate 2-methyltransferase